MWFQRMLKDRQEILVLGELALFVAAWGLGIAAAVNDYQLRINTQAANEVTAKVSFQEEAESDATESGTRDTFGPSSLGPSSLRQRFLHQSGEFE